MTSTRPFRFAVQAHVGPGAPIPTTATAFREMARTGRTPARVMDERRDRDKMVWFFLEALVALLIAVAFVAWTMGPKRRKPPRDRDRD